MSVSGYMTSKRSACFADFAFPLHGIVTRSQLLRMLKHRIGFLTNLQGKLPSSQTFIPSDQARPWKFTLLGVEKQASDQAQNTLQQRCTCDLEV